MSMGHFNSQESPFSIKASLVKDKKTRVLIVLRKEAKAMTANKGRQC